MHSSEYTYSLTRFQDANSLQNTEDRTSRLHPVHQYLSVALKQISVKLGASCDSLETAMLQFVSTFSFPPDLNVSSISEGQWGLLALACMRVLLSCHRITNDNSLQILDMGDSLSKVRF